VKYLQQLSIFDIIVWHTNGVWQDWNLGIIPPYLQSQASLLLLALNSGAFIEAIFSRLGRCWILGKRSLQGSFIA